ncbi:Uncharacterised protein [Mycobacterium tuberculosis]|uniref:Uncharacterized protein n=1 Tax=Mycobacterium tuberculosis TaxID=1773 RepID=A0A655FXK0_MYCTX|nr:Uncharacterised protein [Mycobacterium tuberculosis]CNW67117.1 Uncharacterised protein [Mycobacterium tuberculosis]
MLAGSSSRSAVIAAHDECPQTTTELTPSWLTAKSSAASTDRSSGSVGTRLPRLRTVYRSPGPLAVMTFGRIRESAQVRNSSYGSCESVSPAICGCSTAAPLR